MNEQAKFYLKDCPLRDEPYHLKGVGLPNIFLLNGVTIDNDSDYGELISIENIDGLYRAIGLHIVEKNSAMTGAELRFLRKQMDLTQLALGEMLSVSDQTIANYEKNKSSVGPADWAMRVMYLLHVLPPESKTSLLRQLLEIEAPRKKHHKPRSRLPEMPRRKLVGSWQEPMCMAA